MNERKFDAGSLAEQIDSARRSLDALPEKLKETTLFQGLNHSFDDATTDDQNASSQAAEHSESTKR